ncbi:MULTISPECIES: hypothetical protein [unclassified Streptomyces]|uniref:hypothetical protein n=1 Tax=unclassified Streptomyces TaxID=2593676 RepID=UPI0036E65856
MSGTDPVDPVGVPVFTGDLALLDTKVTELSTRGAEIATAAGDVHSSFGGLHAFYKAPEAEQLFATTKPVADTGLSLSSDLCVIAGALSTYSDDAYPLVEKLKELKREAVAFRIKVDGDDKWREDGDLVEENNSRRNEIAEAWAAFQEVERTCHAAIVALVDGKALKTNDGSTRKGMYGYDAEALKQAKSLPWGDAVEESTPWWHVWEHAYDFGKGFIVDGVWGTIKGLGTLTGFDGWDAAKQAWNGLAKLATSGLITVTPGANVAFWLLPDDSLPSWVRDSRTATKETAKAMVAWDQWGNNPSRAAGTLTFNVLTTAFTGGTGGAVAGGGKAGITAKALSVANKASKAVDPMTYIFKGAGAGLTKISDVMTELKGMGRTEIPQIDEGAFSLPDGGRTLPDGTIQLPPGAVIPEGAIRLSEGNIKLPEGTVTLPPGTVKLPFAESPAKYADGEGNLYREDGTLFQHGDDARTEKAPDTALVANTPKADASVKVPVRELIGGGPGDDAFRLRSDSSAPVHAVGNSAHPDTTPGNRAGGNTPRSELDNTSSDGSIHPDVAPLTAGGRPNDLAIGTTHTDGPTTSGGRPDAPSTGGGHGPSGGFTADDAISGTRDHAGEMLPGSSATDGAARTGDEAPRAPQEAAHTVEYEAAREVPPNDRTPEQRAAVTREHVRLANEGGPWFEEHYDGIGRRQSARRMVDGQLLPKLAEREGGGWTAADDLPHANGEKFRLEPLNRGRATVAPDDLKHLDDVSAKRRAGMELTAAEKKYEADPSVGHADALTEAQTKFDNSVGQGVSNNSKLGEALGEEASRRHILLQEQFKGFREVTDLPETPNGSRRFDQLWRSEDGNLVIVEAKGPNATLLWRRGNGDLDRGTMVKQGTLEYVRTILADMESRALTTPLDGKYAAEIRAALKSKTLQYVLVQATENPGTYAGATLEYFKIF